MNYKVIIDCPTKASAMEVGKLVIDEIPEIRKFVIQEIDEK